MKTTLILLFLAFTAPYAFSQNSEDENLKKVIKAETDAFYNRDADAYQINWVHSPKITARYVANGGYNAVLGWDSLQAIITRYFAGNPKTEVDIKNDGFNISSSENMALVEYDQTVVTHGKDSNTTTQSHEYRVLVKENNQWKILSLVTSDISSYTSMSAQSIENTINGAGYNLMNAGRLNDAIEVFKVNVKINPKAWNPYDSLGEALASAGKKKEAIENYEMSVKLNPKNDNGVKALEKLKAK